MIVCDRCGKELGATMETIGVYKFQATLMFQSWDMQFCYTCYLRMEAAIVKALEPLAALEKRNQGCQQ